MLPLVTSAARTSSRARLLQGRFVKVLCVTTALSLSLAVHVTLPMLGRLLGATANEMAAFIDEYAVAGRSASQAGELRACAIATMRAVEQVASGEVKQ